MKRALISVSDRAGVVDFGRALVGRGWELLSTGGTLEALRGAGVPATGVAEVTGFPEMLGGRVKTLHPAIHGGILARRDGTSVDGTHMAELEAQGIAPIDLVCVNLYPFRETLSGGAGPDEVTENIDIGGPAMIRAAAKNHAFVLVVVDPADYPLALEDEVGLRQRRGLAAKAFGHTAAYDAAITAYLEGQDDLEGQQASFPARRTLELTRVSEVRYGENPHQPAAVYRLGDQRGPVLDATKLSGKPMSFNNLLDADAAWALVGEFPASQGAACVCVKHANPCGVALGPDARSAWERARDADTLSVYGGIVALNVPLDLDAAQATRGTFLEVVIAPGVSEEALGWLRAKKPDLRVLVAGPAGLSGTEYRPLVGGLLAQARDARSWDDLCPEVVSRRQPTEAQWADLAFAWRVTKHARSNNVVLAQGGVTVGVGAGAVSRIWAAERAILNAGERARGAVLASEAFFPYDDVVRSAAAAGVTAVLQPGGAKRDPAVIAAADELGLILVFTGSRHFRH
ncbi:MAG: bifunctional phosphoribosylaminoimidazolecarboxamide formyltransferase/IMP cyclohydrolase [Deinococcus sp.]